jgi:hypothetical protein
MLEVGLAQFFATASLYQLLSYDELSRRYAIYEALPREFWLLFGVVALTCAIVLVRARSWPILKSVAASVLAIQGALFATLYASYAGFYPSLLMWSLWTLLPIVVAATVATATYMCMPRRQSGPWLMRS